MRLHKNQKVRVLAPVLLVIAVSVFSMFPTSYAAEVKSRYISLETSVPSAVSNHRFGFNLATAGTLGSIELEYCDNNPLVGEPCSPPAGLSLIGANLSAQNGETGFSIHASSTANKVILTRVPIAASPQPVMYQLNDVTNPSTANQTNFVRISTFASDDATGPRIDTGGVAFSTSGGLSVNTYVPPFLIFCVAINVAPNCSNSSGSSINLGDLSRTSARVATSQFAAATNDFTGYSASILGTTMTSGNNIIPALATPTPSNPGTSQFGMNLRANTNPTVGQNPLGAGTGTVMPNYNSPNQFSFQNGSQLVSSNLSTNYNTFTVSYMVNINASQPPGIYSTTFTYVATASF